jgi:hypothetical protein
VVLDPILGCRVLQQVEYYIVFWHSCNYVKFERTMMSWSPFGMSEKSNFVTPLFFSLPPSPPLPSPTHTHTQTRKRNMSKRYFGIPGPIRTAFELTNWFVWRKKNTPDAATLMLHT